MSTSSDTKELGLSRHHQTFQFSTAVTILCGDKTFTVDKTALTTHSKYFQACLSGPWIETQTQTVTLDDVDAEVLRLYLFFAQRLAFSSDVSTFQLFGSYDDPGSFKLTATLTEMLRLWKLCDYLQNEELAGGFMSLINCVIHGWRFLYSKDLTASLQALQRRGHTRAWLYRSELELQDPELCFRNFVEAYDYCDRHPEIMEKFGGNIIYYFAYGVTSEEWTAHSAAIEDNHAFIFAVSKQFALMMSNAMQNPRLYFTLQPRYT